MISFHKNTPVHQYFKYFSLSLNIDYIFTYFWIHMYRYMGVRECEQYWYLVRMGILTLQWDHKFLVYRILCNRYAKHSGRHNVDRSRELLVMLMPPTGGNLHDDPSPASSPFLFQMSCMGWQNNFGTFSDSQYFQSDSHEIIYTK